MEDNKAVRRTKFVLLPLGVFMVTAVVNIKAPGTLVRGGSAFFCFDLNRVLQTIERAVYEGLRSFRSDYMGNPVIVICMVLSALFIVMEIADKEYRFSFRYPVLVVAMTFGSYLAMYAPTYYAGVGTPFGRMSNLISFYFELSFIFDIIYVAGYVMNVLRRRGKNMPASVKEMWKRCKIYLIGMAMLVILFHPEWYRNTAVVRTVCYLASGEAEQFGREMDERYEILLNDNIKIAELEPFSVSAGVLFYYDIVEDPDEWPNYALADFFNKDIVKLKEK